MAHADKTRQEYIDNWNANFPLTCGPVTLFHWNTMLSALRERQALELIFAQTPLFNEHKVGTLPSCHILDRFDLENARFRIIEATPTFYDPESNGGKGTAQWSSLLDKFFEDAGIGNPNAPEDNKWTNIPDRLGNTPKYGFNVDPCQPLYREQFNELISAIKLLTRIKIDTSGDPSPTIRRDRVVGISDNLQDAQAALDQAQARASAAAILSQHAVAHTGYFASYISGGDPEEFAYTVEYRNFAPGVALNVLASTYDLIPDDLEYDNQTMIVEFDTTGVINNGNGPTIDGGVILGIMPIRDPDDIPDSGTGSKVGAVYSQSADGIGKIFLPWAVGKVPPPHFAPHSQAEDRMRLIFQIQDYESSRSHISDDDVWDLAGTTAAIYATITNLQFR